MADQKVARVKPSDDLPRDPKRVKFEAKYNLETWYEMQRDHTVLQALRFNIANYVISSSDFKFVDTDPETGQRRNQYPTNLIIYVRDEMNLWIRHLENKDELKAIYVEFPRIYDEATIQSQPAYVAWLMDHVAENPATRKVLDKVDAKYVPPLLNPNAFQCASMFVLNRYADACFQEAVGLIHSKPDCYFQAHPKDKYKRGEVIAALLGMYEHWPTSRATILGLWPWILRHTAETKTGFEWRGNETRQSTLRGKNKAHFAPFNLL